MLSRVINYEIIKNVIKTIINLYIENIEAFLSIELGSNIASLLQIIYNNSCDELIDVIKEILLDNSNLLTSEKIDDVLISFTKFVL